ncbi:Aste57867_8117 [Aphanomyces stellatus]|uniref:Aste57867_8117 protein n=1 Tax=Aphanomyces stellatus TaxID=120398 RepID=A0A485KJE0_9STRA|nr:hypothetical protein As57867_008087 [Aphanomyces stellatus]VFT85006.1 Aste57867_8117 [Aphanomyces stellatus]
MSDGHDDQWDDLAILKAFDAALNKHNAGPPAAATPKTRKKSSTAPAGTSSARQSLVIHATPPVSPVTSAAPQGQVQHPSPQSRRPSNAPFPSPPTPYTDGHAYYGGIPPPAYQQLHHYPTSDPYTQAAPMPPNMTAAYADAYARAYAQAVTQGHSLPYGTHVPPPTPPTCPYGCQQHAPPSVGGEFPGMALPPMEGDDDLSKLLLSWYQSGYYAGRYKAIQEMKQQQHYRR